MFWSWEQVREGTKSVTRNRRPRPIVEELEDRHLLSTVFAVTDAGPGLQQLLSFDSATPGTTSSPTPGAITGTGAGEAIVGIDFRPSNGMLYAVTKDGANLGRIYTLNTATEVATLVTSTPFALGASTAYGIDFNPAADLLRVVGNTAGLNIRVNPTTGNLFTTDTTLAYALGDPSGPGTPALVGAAYTNNLPGTTATTLYGIDTLPLNDQLVLQGGLNGVPSPNGGQVFTVKGLATATGTVPTDDRVGFDITADNRAFASVTTGATSDFYQVNVGLGTPSLTLVGAISAGGSAIRDVAVAPAGVFRFSQPAFSVAEGGTLTVTVQRFGGTAGTVMVHFMTASGSAASGSDFVPTSGTLTFLPGQTSQTFTLTANADVFLEGTQSFSLLLTNPTGGAVVSPTAGLGTATVNILDNTTLPPVTNISASLRVVSSTARLAAPGRVRRRFRLRNLSSSFILGNRIALVFDALRGRLFARPGQFLGLTAGRRRFLVISVPTIPPGGERLVDVDFGFGAVGRSVTRIFGGFGVIP